MTVIATSTAATATAYSSQRKIDRCSNGVLWAFFVGQFSLLESWCSLDDGVTWTLDDATSTINTGYTQLYNASVFIDADDCAHVVWKQKGNTSVGDGGPYTEGYIYYRRGTPNAARTAWTWSAAVQASSGSSSDNYPDVVAHREGTGWIAHVIGSQVFSSNTFTWYTPMTITSGGSITKGTTSFIGNGGSGYPSTTPTYPSIDFNHTGDGKTVAGSTPHLYAAWSAGAAGAGKGIRFRKATYSAGAWTWGTEREIDSTRYIPSNAYWLPCLFDGTRVVLAGILSTEDIMLYERDAADTTTTTRALVDNAVAGAWLADGSFSYDASGNLYLFGRSGGFGSALHCRKWARSTMTLESAVVVDSASGNQPYVAAKRGYSNRKIEYIYIDGTASPYSVTYDSIDLNTLPTKPTLVTVQSPAVAGQADASWQHNDPDGDPQSKWKYRLRKV